VLLLWRHRFITVTWGWEIPVGRAEPGGSPAQAAAREVEEETGWRPGLWWNHPRQPGTWPAADPAPAAARLAALARPGTA